MLYRMFASLAKSCKMINVCIIFVRRVRRNTDSPGTSLLFKTHSAPGKCYSVPTRLDVHQPIVSSFTSSKTYSQYITTYTPLICKHFINKLSTLARLFRLSFSLLVCIHNLGFLSHIYSLNRRLFIDSLM